MSTHRTHHTQVSHTHTHTAHTISTPRTRTCNQLTPPATASGTDITNGEEVAIKLENVSSPHPQLQYESKLYKLLQGGGASIVPRSCSSHSEPCRVCPRDRSAGKAKESQRRVASYRALSCVSERRTSTEREGAPAPGRLIPSPVVCVREMGQHGKRRRTSAVLLKSNAEWSGALLFSLRVGEGSKDDEPLGAHVDNRNGTLCATLPFAKPYKAAVRPHPCLPRVSTPASPCCSRPTASTCLLIFYPRHTRAFPTHS